MVEACFICLDSTEYMRNGDQYPTRMMAEQDAACLLTNSKLQTNVENTLGFLTTGGNACTVHETLTSNVDAVMTSIGSIQISGRCCNFRSGLLIAALALSHRTNSRAEKRIVAFVGSPVREGEAELEALAKKLRKDEVAVDVVAFGVESNVPLLQAFVAKVSKKENSRFLSVAAGESLTDKLMTNAILLGEDAAEQGEGGSGGAAAGGFGVDPNMDPELAMALRLSMEDEMQRQARAAASPVSAAATTGGSTPTPPAPASPPPSTTQQPHVEDADLAQMSEEEMIRRAIELSLQESSTPAAPAQTSDAHHNEEEDSDDFAKNVEEALEKQDEEQNGSPK